MRELNFDDVSVFPSSPAVENISRRRGSDSKDVFAGRNVLRYLDGAF